MKVKIHKMTINPQTTLEQGKQFLRETWLEGAECPCCHQLVRKWIRKLDSQMAYTLILMYKHHKIHGMQEWIHVHGMVSALGKKPMNDYVKLRFWGLIEQMDGERQDGSKRVGYWRITEKGVDFVRGLIQVQRHIGFYNKSYKVVEDGEYTTIREALGDKFDYREMMGEYFEDSDVKSSEQTKLI